MNCHELLIFLGLWLGSSVTFAFICGAAIDLRNKRG